MSRNIRNRYISAAMAIAGLIAFISILIIELVYDKDVNNWFFYAAFCALFVGAMQFFRNR